jgi:hypothetical protein
MMGKGMKDLTFGFIPLPNIPQPLFLLGSGRSKTRRLLAVRVKLECVGPAGLPLTPTGPGGIVKIVSFS